MADRIGIGWRPPLAAAILSSLDRIDVVEVLAEEHASASRTDLRALATLGAQVPVVLHGTSLGLASVTPVDDRRLDAMARLVDAARPGSWSEHLAFVRAGGREIGHLAAPPRTAATAEGLARNVLRATAVVGAPPQLENVATLAIPPGSVMDEATWLAACLGASGADMLLDLHNLHANATNFGFDAGEALARLPMDRVATIHLAGGRPFGPEGATRILDDHLHDTPQPVFDLLETVAGLAPRDLVVILERDGRFPPFGRLLTELDAARAAVARGRAHRREAA